MGGAWAYEALSFGGFWAGSGGELFLVPWLTLVAGAHLLLINRNHKKLALFSVHFLLISFLLVCTAPFRPSPESSEIRRYSFVDSGISRNC